LAGDLSSDRQLDSWIQESAKGDVAFPFGAAGTDDQARQAFSRVVQRIDGLSRGQLGLSIVGADGGLLNPMEQNHDVTLLGFSESAVPIRREVLAQLGPPTGAATDLGAPLDAATSAADNPTVAVVLLTDGRHTTDVSPVTKAAVLGKAGVPIYPVLLGSRVPPPDLAIARVQAPATVFKGAEAALTVTVQANALNGRTLSVEVVRPGHPPIVERIEHPGGSRQHVIRIPVRLEESGVHPLTVRVHPEPEDTHPENDSRTATIQVADDRAKVLLIDGEARWEHHYLAAALARDPSIEVQSIIFSQPRIGRTIDGDDATAALPARRLPSEPDALDVYDAIVVGDVTPEQLSAEDRARLDRYVTERGGTLIVTAGKRAMPNAYFRSSFDNDPIRKLLPIDTCRIVTSMTGFSLSPTSEGALASFLQLGNTLGASVERWADLPKIYWGALGRVKPGAAVLATDRDPNATTSGDIATWEKEHALVAWHNVGFGRVLYIGVDGTWRFRLRIGDAIHHRFWGQILRWAAADQPLMAGNASVRFGARRSIVPQGEDVEIAARWLDIRQPLKLNSAASVRIVRTMPNRPDEPVATVPLSRQESRPRDLAAKIRDLPAGEYAAELVIPDRASELTVAGPGGKASPLRAHFRVTPRESTELSDLSCDIPLLEEIAAKSGGRVFQADEASQIVPLLAQRMITRDVHHERRLAESWITLVALLLLLGFEWALRKAAGLP
jgi:hypothetical protein